MTWRSIVFSLAVLAAGVAGFAYHAGWSYEELDAVGIPLSRIETSLGSRLVGPVDLVTGSVGIEKITASISPDADGVDLLLIGTIDDQKASFSCNSVQLTADAGATRIVNPDACVQMTGPWPADDRYATYYSQEITNIKMEGLPEGHSLVLVDYYEDSVFLKSVEGDYPLSGWYALFVTMACLAGLMLAAVTWRFWWVIFEIMLMPFYVLEALS